MFVWPLLPFLPHSCHLLLLPPLALLLLLLYCCSGVAKL
jgi:hypothetical protein